MIGMTIVKTVFLKAPPEQVWKLLTRADQLALWFHPCSHDLVHEGEYELAIDSAGEEGARSCWGRVVELKEPAHLVYTFTHDWLDGVETTCTWTLEAVEGGTVLTLVHEGWNQVEKDAFGMAAEHDKGWDEHFARLRQVVN